MQLQKEGKVKHSVHCTHILYPRTVLTHYTHHTIRITLYSSKVKHIGVSNFGVTQLKEAMATGTVDCAINRVLKEAMATGTADCAINRVLKEAMATGTVV
jgi:diketogulonate reductase-like aldo/keto reductase